MKKLRLIILILVLSICSQYSFADDFTATTLESYKDITVIEVVGDYDAPTLNCQTCGDARRTIAKEFFKTHSDDYDFLVVFADFNFMMPKFEIAGRTTTAAGFYSHVKNDVVGIGLSQYNHSSLFGSSGKLQGMIDMGPLASVVTEPFDPAFKKTMGTLSHEILHRWSAYVHFKDGSGQTSDALLGSAGSHWSYLLDTSGSLQYGNNWQVNGDGTFTALSGRKYYSDLDLYLMGVIGKEKVKPMMLIDNPEINKEKITEPGAVIEGLPLEVTIDDIIAVEGERIPSVENSQKDFKIGCILLSRPGQFSEEDLLSIRFFAENAGMWFSSLTDGNASICFDARLPEIIPGNPGITPPVVGPSIITPSLFAGVNWLKGQQVQDGKWSDSDITAQRDTSQVVLILKNFGEAAQERDKGLNWLKNTTSGNSDYLSRKIQILTEYGEDVNDYVSTLLARQNPDGGWGAESKYTSTVEDTTFALTALGISGYSDTNAIVPAIEFIKSKQNPNGGWGNSKESEIRVTANALMSFYYFAAGDAFSNDISRAFAWLEQLTHDDGGYGAAESNVYDTANVLYLKKVYGAANQDLQAAVNYLNSLQTNNGSWNNSPFETAIAINAIWKATVEPELSITLDPISISTLPVDLVLSAHLTNNGLTDVPAVSVVLYRDGVKIEEKIVAAPGMTPVDVQFTVEVKNTTERVYSIVVDPQNSVAESNERNNMVIREVYPDHLATYDFVAESITLSSDTAGYLTPVTINTRITNRGTENALQVPVKYSVDNGAVITQIATIIVDLNAGKSIDSEIIWRCDKAGDNLKIIAHVDAEDIFSEEDNDNNSTFAILSVDASTKTNLSVTHDTISLTPAKIVENGNAQISAEIRNNGFTAAEAFSVNLYNGNPDTGGFLIDSKSIKVLTAGESDLLVFDWDTIGCNGNQLIYVQIDPKANNEITLEDNVAFKAINIMSLPDLLIGEKSIVFSPPISKEGDLVRLTIVIQNAGDQDATDVPVVVTENGSLISPIDFKADVIPGQSQQTLSLTYDTTGKPGTHKVEVKVDPNNLITERTTVNNDASRIFSVQDYDHWVSEIYISPDGDGVQDETQAFFRLQEKMDLIVQIEDEKRETVRHFAGDDFTGTDAVSVVWDGRNNKGVVVSDGNYIIVVYDTEHKIVSELYVIVDNNRSPFTEAVGTEFLLKSKLLENFGSDPKWQWFPDESGIIVFPGFSYSNVFSKGIYTIAPDGTAITRLTPEKWANGEDDSYNYYIGNNPVFSEGGKVAVSVTKRKKIDSSYSYDIWLVDRNANVVKMLHSSEEPEGRFQPLTWSPDEAYIACEGYNTNKYFLMDMDGLKLQTFEPFFSQEEEPITYSNNFIADWKEDSSGFNLFTQFRTDGSYHSKVKVFSCSLSGALEKIIVFEPSEASEIYGSTVTNIDESRFIFSPGEGSSMLVNISANGDNIDLHNYDETPPVLCRVNNKVAFITRSPEKIEIKILEDNKITSVYEKDYVQYVSGGRYSYYDEDGNYHEGEYQGRGNNEYYSYISNLAWSNDGKSLLFIDRTYEKTGDCSHDSYQVTLDVKTLEQNAVRVAGPNYTCLEQESSYHIYCWEKNDWVERGVFHYVDRFETKELELSGWTDGNSSLKKMRIIQTGALGAEIDYISLRINDSTIEPAWAFSAEDVNILSDIVKLDGNRADAYQKTIDVTWENLPGNPDELIFMMNANERRPYSAEPWNSEWIENKTSLVGLDSMGLWTLHLETGRKLYLPVEAQQGSNITVSPYDNHIVYQNNDWDYESLTSLLNLKADLRISRQKSSVLLQGIAVDLNFSSFKLEYSDVTANDNWNLICPPGNKPVVNDLFTTWVPPYEGTFYVRLTVYDKAGNSITDRKRIMWGLSSSISSLYLSTDIFSPKNINGNDLVDLNYRVLEPVHLTFTIYDDNNEPVKTVEANHDVTGEFLITWDGRDSVDEFVADGRYKIQVFDYYYYVDIDNTFPDVTLSRDDICNIITSKDPFLTERKCGFLGRIEEQQLKSWRLEYSSLANPDVWQEFPAFDLAIHNPQTLMADEIPYIEISKALLNDEISLLKDNNFKLTAIDYAGNTSIAETSTWLNEIVLIKDWQDKPVALGEECSSDLLTSETLIDKDDLGSTSNKIGIFETITKPIVSVNFQYRDQGVWKNSDDVTGFNGDISELNWDNSALNMRFVDALRLILTDVNGVTYQSNVIVLKILFELFQKDMTAVQSNSGNGVSVPLVRLEFLYREKEPGTDEYSNWQAYKVYDIRDDVLIPSGVMPIPPVRDGELIDDKNYQIQMVGIDKLGNELYSNIINQSWSNWLFSLSSSYMDAECDTKSEKIQLLPRLEKGKENCHGLVIERLDYYLAKETNDYYEANPDVEIEYDLVNTTDYKTNPDNEMTLWVRRGGEYQSEAIPVAGFIDLPANPVIPVYCGDESTLWYGQLGTYTLDVSGLKNGEYRVKAVITAKHDGVDLTKIDYSDVEVEHMDLPYISPLEIPADSGCSCIKSFDKMVGTEVVYGSGTLYYREENAADPEWKKGRVAKFDDAKYWILECDTGACLDEGFKPVNTYKSYDLKIELIGPTKNKSCVFKTIDFCNDEKSIPINLNTERFSPNGDGKDDTLICNYEVVGPDASIDIQLFQVVMNNNVKDDILITTYIQNVDRTAGTYALTWDGTNPVPNDGTYYFRVTGKYPCGKTVVNDSKYIAVDVSPPIVDIKYPQGADPLGALVEVKGTVSDVHFKDYLVELFNSDIAITINTSEQAVNDSIIGRIESGLYKGAWTLRIIANDTFGNTTTKSVQLDFDNQLFLIGRINASNKFFSPGSSGALDKTIVQYELLEQCNITGEFLLGGELVKTFNVTDGMPGLVYYEWDGKGLINAYVPDGDYTLMLTAELSSDTSVTQKESITLGIDRTVPQFDFTPADGSYYKDLVLISGSIDDANIKDYSVAYRFNDMTIDVDDGTQIRENYLFTTLSKPEEGEYNLIVKAEDILGQSSELNSVFIVDRTPPEQTLTSPVNGGFYGGDNTVIDIKGLITEVNPATWVLRYGLGGSPTQWTTLTEGTSLPATENIFSWVVGKDSGLADGMYTLSLETIDKVGLETDTRLQVYIDNTLPEVSSSNPANGTYLTKPAVITGTASDPNIDNYSVEISNGACTGSCKWSGIAGGKKSVNNGPLASLETLPEDAAYCLKIIATDKSGNTSESLSAFIVDTVPPSIPDNLQGEIVDKDSVQLNWNSVSDSDLAGYNVYRDNQIIKTITTSETQTIDENREEGQYTYTVTALDHAGHESEPAKAVSIQIDFTPPSVAIKTPVDTGIINDLVNIMGTAYSLDDFKEYRLSLADTLSPEAWTLLKTSIVPVTYGVLAQNTSMILGEGDYLLKLEAEDIYGNINTVQTSFSVETTPPPAPILNQPVVIGNTAELSWEPVPADDLDGYYLYRNGNLANVTGTVAGDLSPFMIKTTSFTDRGLPDGPYTYYVEAVDVAGNISDASNMQDISIDTRAPVVQIVTPENGIVSENAVAVEAVSEDNDIKRIDFQYRKQSASSFETFHSTETDQYATSFNPKGLGLAYDVYELRVSATDNADQTGISGIVSVTYKDLTPPPVPTVPELIVNGGDLTLNWQQSSDGITDLAGNNIYLIKYNERTKLNIAPVKTNTYSLTDMADGEPIFEITSVDTTGNESLPTAQIIGHVYTPTLTTESQVVTEAVIAITGTTLNPESMMELFVDSGSGSVSTGTVGADGNGEFSYNLTLAQGENSIFVKATDSSGNISKMSDAIVIVYDLPPQPPVVLGATASLSDTVLTWQLNSEPDIDRYNIYRKSDGDWEKINTALVKTSPHTDAGLKNGSYQYKMTAVDIFALESGFSNSVTVEINTALPEAPIGLVVSGLPEGGGEITLCWSHPEIPAGYIIYRSIETGTGYKAIEERLHGENCFTDSGLSDGVSYYYVVTAKDAKGNESNRSNEVTAVPLDSKLPDMPALFQPCRNGESVKSQTGKIDISGMAEPSASVTLFKNNNTVATVTARSTTLFQLYDYNDEGDSYDVSSDGKNVAIVNNYDALSLYNTADSSTIMVSDSSMGMAFSPDGLHLAFFGTTGTGVYDLETGTTTNVVEIDPELNWPVLSWSPDSELIAFVRSVEGVENIWTYEPATGKQIKQTDVPSGIYAKTPKFSPGNDKLAYLEFDTVSQESVLAVIDLDTREIVRIDGKNISRSHSSFTWSPDGRQIAFVADESDTGWLYICNMDTFTVKLITGDGYRNFFEWGPAGDKLAYTYGTDGDSLLNVYDLSTEGVTPVADDVDYFTWSPCGSRLLYTPYGDNGNNEIYVKSIDNPGKRLTLYSRGEQTLGYLKWLNNGKILHVYYDYMYGNDQIVELTPAGLFTFKALELDQGSNIFDATATDLSQNTSLRSGSIDVILDSEFLPDFQVSEENINLMPSSPMQGDSINVFVAIENTGKSTVENIPVDVWLWAPSGEAIRVHESVIPVMGAGAQSFISFTIDNSSAGVHEILVDIDPDNIVMEGNESNNTGSREFFVSTVEGLTMKLSLNPSAYGGNDDIQVETEIYNAGFDTECFLELRVKDEEGYLIETILSQSLMLPYGSMEKIRTVWNTGDIYAGQYVIEAVISDINGIIEEASVPFSVNLSAGVSSELTTDKSVYDANQDAEIKAGIFNNGDLFCIPELDITLTVTTDNDSELFSQSFSIVNLLSGTPSSHNIIWNTGLNSPGTYKAGLRVMADGELLEEKSTSFEIRSSLLIRGTIQSDVALAMPGDLIQFDYSVTSHGNEAPFALPVSVIVIDPDSNAVVASSQATITLGMNDTILNSAVISTEGFEMKTYKVVLRYHEVNGYDNLASTAFSLADLHAPYIKVNSPDAGETYIGDVKFDITVGDTASQIQSVELMLDGDSWQPMVNVDANSGRWYSGWDAGDSTGDHTVAFRATDSAGNEVQTDPIQFIIEKPHLEITGSLSLTPQGGTTMVAVQAAYTVSNNGNIAANDLSVRLSVFKAGVDESVITEENNVTVSNGSTYTNGYSILTPGFESGDYSVKLAYLNPETDDWTELAAAGFEIKDQYPPELTILSPLSGAVYDGTCEFAVSATDDVSGVDRVEYNLDNDGWIELPLTDAAGSRYSTLWEPQLSDDGLRSVRFRAMDLGGNVSEIVSVSFTIELMNNAFEQITGTLSVLPATVYQWQGVDFDYTLSNPTAKDAGDLAVIVTIKDSATGVTMETFERQETLSTSAVVTGDFGIGQVDLPVAAYTVILGVKNNDQVIRELASTGFTVEKTVNVEPPVEPDVTNLLVWVNDNCQTPKGDETETNWAQCIFEDCVRVDLIEQIMEASTDNYYIVYEEEDFRNELRNPFYTDIFILGTTMLPDLTTIAEVIEKSNTGTGIASSLWMQQGVTIGNCFELSSIFGITWNGVVLSLNHDLITTDGIVTDAGGFDARGLAYVVVPDDDAVVEARFKEDTHHFSDDPAIVLNEHGNGKTAYFAFDLGLALDDDSYDTLKDIITRTIAYIHTEKTSTDNYPNRIVPVEVRMESYSGEYSGQNVTSFSPPLKMYDTTTGELTSESPQTFGKAVQPGETGSFTAYLLAPESSGSWPVASETGIVLNDIFIPVEILTSDIKVDISRDIFAAEILAEIKNIDVSFLYQIQKTIAVRAFKPVVSREVTSKCDVDANISNIISTIHALYLLKRNDLSGLRIKLDKLLGIEQSRYYFFNK